jgi:thiol:disulfide interchange protein DsbG
MRLLSLLAALLLLIPVSAWAQTETQAQDTTIPELPAPIKNLVDEGAQLRYLGRDYGLDAWITIKNGQEQYFYVMPDRSAFTMGLLFDGEGKLITMDQVQRLRAKGDNLLDTLAEEDFSDIEANRNNPAKADALTSPSERLFADIETSNWVPIGKPDAPVIYSFIDPQCPHCHEFISDLRQKGLLDSGTLQVRMIPVGFKDETRAQAAYLMATPDPQKSWFAHMDGDKTALPAKTEINQQGVQKNLAVMQSWEFNVTPMIVYRAKNGTVKLVRGRPKDLDGMIADIGTGS